MSMSKSKEIRSYAVAVLESERELRSLGKDLYGWNRVGQSDGTQGLESGLFWGLLLAMLLVLVLLFGLVILA